MNTISPITTHEAVPVSARELYRPTPEDTQAAVAVLHQEWCAQWESARSEREARIRRRMSDWLTYCWGCRRRADEYRHLKAQHAPGTGNHKYYHTREAEQMAKAREALSFARMERNAL